ncbi:MAG: carboxypeptidase regulatory-like domain-containing protein [Acidobacteria bacterium]|nr:carboxypeptidase regulatory-like domain-containing protein [Acidobacteriota bacterium]MCW5950169.1 carboxypeptidase regulatory-like domain-containing protein [Pyrinomonadaceae bacterium]
MKIRALVIVALMALSALLIAEASGRPPAARPPGVISGPLYGRAIASASTGRMDALKAETAEHGGGPAARSAGPDIRYSENTDRRKGRDTQASEFALVPMPDPNLSFDGLSNYDNVAAYNLLIMPPDMNGDVGPAHYVQTVNALWRVYYKSGTPATAPLKFSQLFAPLGTACSQRNDGLPNVLYDPLADRWLISQYCYDFPPFRQMIAVSKTGDPAGEYFVWEFVMPNIRIPDFPKFGVWTDGYYMSTEEFVGADYGGAGVFAFDRTRMLAGEPSPSFVYFNVSTDSVQRRRNFIPTDLDGLRPPPQGAPNYFVSYTADEYGDAADALRIFEFRADFGSPAASSFAERPESPIAVASFDPTSNDGRTDIAQPPPGDFLDANSDRINPRAAYRNLGSAESIVLNQTVRTGSAPYRAGVRLSQLVRQGTGQFAVAENTTVGDAVSSRWIGSAAQDHQGDIAVAYNYVSDEKRPAVRYAGRLANEPQGMIRTEASLVEGTGVQKAFGWRWGDYSSLSVDPVDDCTFWATGEYYSQASQDHSDFTWLTRIGTFRFPECAAAPRSSIRGTVTNAQTGAPIPGAGISSGAYSRRTRADGNYGDLFVLPGSYSVSASAKGFRTETVNITVANGETLVRNFALAPVPVPEVSGSSVVGESCVPNGAPDPGESVTFALALANSGSLSTSSLNVTLLASGGVTQPGPSQNYGSIPAGGGPVVRNFGFTVSNSLACGAELTLTFELNDGGSPLGQLVVKLPTGVEKVALSQRFDRQAGPSLPQRWTTTASGVQSTWSVVRSRSTSEAKSIFSPAPNNVGLNELVTPVFRITTQNARLTFKNWYDLETTFLRNRLYDGAVLEIRVGGGPWRDIVEAGGAFEMGGYDGTIDTCCQNPLGGRLGWSGRSGVEQTAVFITSSVRLPASAAGQDVQLRWRVGTDIGTFREGMYIDDVAVTDGYVCGCVN